MPAPSKVEFPGKKRQRAKMRGTKQANEATAKKLARELGQFRENPEATYQRWRFPVNYAGAGRTL